MKTLFLLLTFVLLVGCAEKKKNTLETISTENKDFGSYDSQEKWGEHLVTILDCNACHTPKKMTDHGPVADNSLLLSGHPAAMPRIEIDRK